MINRFLSPVTQERCGPFRIILSNASSLTGARILGDILSFFLFIILSRQFGPEGIGQFAYGLAIGGFVFVAVNWGLEDYAIRECARLPMESRSTLVGQLVGIQLASMLCVTGGLICFLLVTKPSNEKTMIILLLSGQQFALALTRTLFAPAFAQQKMAGPAFTELLCRAGIIFFAIMLAAGLHTSLEIALIPYPVGGVVLVAIAVLSAKRHLKVLRPRVTWNRVFKILRSAWPFAAPLLIFYLRSRGNFIIISFILGDGATGIYASSVKLLEFGVMPIFFLGLAAYPNLSGLFEEDKQKFLEFAERFLGVALIIGGLVAWALFFLVPPVATALLGERFAPTTPLIKGMAVLGILTGIATPMTRLLLAMHLEVKRLQISFGSVTINFLLTIALLPLIGIFGAVVAWFIGSIVANILFLEFFQRKMGTTVVIRTLRSFAVLLLGPCLAGSLLTWLTPYTWLPAAASLAAFSPAVLWYRFIAGPKTKRSNGHFVSPVSDKERGSPPDPDSMLPLTHDAEI